MVQAGRRGIQDRRTGTAAEEKTMANLGAHHVGFTSGHWEETVRMYKEGLGFKDVYVWGGDANVHVMDTGNGFLIELFEGTEDPECSIDGHRPHVNGEWMHLALHTDDIRASFDRAVAAGFRPKEEPRYSGVMISLPKPAHMYYAYVIGIDGEEIEFIQPLKEKPEILNP